MAIAKVHEVLKPGRAMVIYGRNFGRQMVELSWKWLQKISDERTRSSAVAVIADRTAYDVRYSRLKNIYSFRL